MITYDVDYSSNHLALGDSYPYPIASAELLVSPPSLTSVQKELETTVEALFNSLADLDELFAAGKLAEKLYWKERLDLKARSMVTLKKASPLLLESYATRHTTSC